MRVFLDANIYLGFIKRSQEKIGYINKFKDYVEGKKFSFLFPKITQDEVFRNIPSMSQRYVLELTNKLPPEVKTAALIKDDKTKRELDKLSNEFNRKLEELGKKYLKSVDALIDDIIKPLVKLAEDIHEDKNIVKNAEIRRLKGNPPGKGKHLGDEIAWELLLEKCTDGSLTIVANDSDWMSPIINNKMELHPFLIQEWKDKSSRKINFFDTLGGFIQTLDKKAVSKEDIEKEREASSVLEDYVSPSVSPSIGSASVASGTSGYSLSPSASPSVSPSASINTCISCGRLFHQPPGFSMKYCESCSKG